MSRLLVVEDEPRLASFLDKGLRADGHAVTVVADGRTASVVACDSDFDLVILDVGLPRMNGFEVLRELRGRGERLPVIMLTARGETEDKIAGLEDGADDYMTKPFRFDELLARVRARLRNEARWEATRLAAGGVVLDVRARRAHVDGTEISLTAREFNLLETLMRHHGQLLSREQLLSQVWGYDHDPSSNVVDVYVGYLRRKLGDVAIIETVRGMGYRLRDGE